MLNINCLFFDRRGYICNHKSRKMFGFIRRLCLKDDNMFAACNLQQEYPKPKLYKPTLQSKR